MIDTVRTLAQPYSHYLMSHRDLVIVLMGLVVMWTVGHDLLTRWRIQRLNRDEAGGRTDPPSVARRTHATAAKAEKAAEPAPAGGRARGPPARPSPPSPTPPFQLPSRQAASAAPPAMPPVGAAPALGVPLSEPVPPPLPTYAPTPVAMTAGPASAPVEPPTAKA